MESGESNSNSSYQRSRSIKITDLDTSHTQVVDEEQLESFGSEYNYANLGPFELSE